MVSGFQPIMPTFQGLVSEEGILQLLEYIKSLKATPSNATGAPVAPAAGAATPGKK
jgi:cytochrome c oxidase subunit 2